MVQKTESYDNRKMSNVQTLNDIVGNLRWENRSFDKNPPADNGHRPNSTTGPTPDFGLANKLSHRTISSQFNGDSKTKNLANILEQKSDKKTQSEWFNKLASWITPEDRFHMTMKNPQTRFDNL